MYGYVIFGNRNNPAAINVNHLNFGISIPNNNNIEGEGDREREIVEHNQNQNPEEELPDLIEHINVEHNVNEQGEQPELSVDLNQEDPPQASNS